jgi:hypothetical protein
MVNRYLSETSFDKFEIPGPDLILMVDSLYVSVQWALPQQQI